MPDPNTVVKILGLIVVGAPVGLMLALGIPSLLNRRLPERTVGWIAPLLINVGLVAALVVLGWMLVPGERRVPIVLGQWVVIPDYHFAVKFEFDRLSVPLVILSLVLCGTIGAFANRYMHREPGFNRFFLLYTMFLVGMVVTSLAGTMR